MCEKETDIIHTCATLHKQVHMHNYTKFLYHSRSQIDHRITLQSKSTSWDINSFERLDLCYALCVAPVSYTHLTLPTIYSV